MAREQRKLYRDKLCAVYSAAYILIVMITSRMRWVSHVTRMGQ